MLIPRGIAREGVDTLQPLFAGYQTCDFLPLKNAGYDTSLINYFPPKTSHAIERDILHRLSWMELRVGDHFNFYITGLLIQFTKFNFTCKMIVETISSRCSSDIHRNDVTFIFLSLQNRLTLRALSLRDSVGGNINITSQKFR